MTEILTTNITYKGLTDGKVTVTLLDSNDKKWVIWKKAYQSEDINEAYAALLNHKFGDTFGVTYTETDESFVNDQNKTINFKRRTIYTIADGILPPDNKSVDSVVKKPIIGNVGGSRDFDKEAIGKCQTLFLQAYIQSGKTFSETLLQVGQAKRLAEMVVYGQTSGEVADTQIDNDINEQTDINVEDIPF